VSSLEYLVAKGVKAELTSLGFTVAKTPGQQGGTKKSEKGIGQHPIEENITDKLTGKALAEMSDAEYLVRTQAGEI
jgi:hypothetical protein